MRRVLHLSAKQTAGLCVLGGLVAAVGFLLETLARATSVHHPHSNASYLWIAAVLTTDVLGIILALYAYSSLENGIVTARWSDQEIESLRAIVNSRPFNFLNIALLALMVASLVMGVLSPHRYPIFWAIFILSQSINWMRNAIRRQASNANPQPKWSNLSPLTSDHWGQH